MIKNILKRIFGYQTGEVKVEPRITRIPLYVGNWRFSTPTKPAPAPMPFVHSKAMTNQEYLKTLSYGASCNLIYHWALNNWSKDSFASDDFLKFINWLETKHDYKEVEL